MCNANFWFSGPNTKVDLTCNMRGRYITLTSSCLPCWGGNQHGQWQGWLTSAKVEIPFCHDCPANSVSTQGSTACSCIQGYVDALTGLDYTNSTSSPCIPADSCSGIPNGIWDLTTSQCKICPVAFYKHNTLTCLPCPPGYALNYSGAASSEQCEPCPPSAYYSTLPASTVCQPCPQNMYSNSSSTQCSYCPEGTYLKNPFLPTGQCAECEPGHYCSLSIKYPCPTNSNSTTGSSSLDQCHCHHGFYKNKPDSCSVCPKGSHCPDTCPA